MKIKKLTLRACTVTAVIMVLIAVLPVIQALAASSGPKNPGVGTSVAGEGTVAWTNPGNITTTGTPYATADLVFFNPTSNYLVGTQYGFAIPAGSTINGITVVIRRQANGTSPDVTDNVVSLTKGGALVGNDKSTGSAWPTSFGTATYGGTADLWGTTWSVAEINANNFGVALSVTRGAFAERTATVDYMQITVTYTPPVATTTTVNCGSGTPVVIYGSSISCVATVTRASGGNTPSGTVSWTTGGSGSFATSPCTLSGSGGTSTCSVSYTPSAVGSGSHLITATYSGDANFSSSTGNQSVTVDQLPITVTAEPKTKVYGETDPMLTYQITSGSLVFGDTFSGSLTRDPGEDVGAYAINQGTLSLPASYDLTYIGDDLTITTLPITVTADPQTKVYGDPDPALTYTVTSGSLVGTDDFSGELTRDTGDDVGTYAITQGTLALSTNYDLSYIGADFTITQATPTLSVDNSPVVYDGTPQAAVVASSELGTVDNILYDGSATVPTDAGTYAVTADFTPEDTLNFVSLTDGPAGDFVIAQRPIAVTADPQTKVYGDPDPELTYQVTGSLVGSDAFTGELARDPGEDVGTYDITQGSLALSTNYHLTYVGDFLTITQATPTLSVDNSPVVYDGTPQAAIVTGSVDGEVSNVLYDGLATIPSDAGTYAVTADFTPEDILNYASLTDEPAGDFVISQLPITVTADPQTKVYGDPDPELTYQVTGTLVGTDAFSGELTRDAGEDVGAYAITQGSLALSANYTLTYVGDDLTITQLPITVTADPQTKVYGDPDPELTYQVTGTLVGTDAFSGELTRDAGEDVGTYAITQGSLALSANYTLTYVGDDLTITQLPITVTADPQTKVYGDPDPELTYQVTGTLVGTDAFSGELTRDAGEDVGTYAITQGSLALSANYTLTYVGDDLTITQATPTLSVTNSPVVYNGLAQAAVVTPSVAGIVSNVRYDGGATVPTDTGTYAVTADFTPTDTLNYTSLTGGSAGNFVITKATPTVSVTNSPVTYNGSPQAAVVLGSVPGAVSNIMYDGSATAPTNAGTYAVTADFTPTDTTNYNNLSGASAGNFVINPVTPTLSVTNSPVVFNGLPQAAVVTGSVAGTVSNVMYDGSATVPTAVGTYAVTADFTPTDATNYTSLTGASAGNFVINPAGPGLTLTKTATPSVFGQPGKVIDYTYLLTNTGDVTLAGPFTVADDKLTDVTCPDTASLAPAASITCTGSYTTTLADVLAGSVTNSATGSGSYATNPVVSNVAQTTVKAIRVFLALLEN